jgi:FixJ family two-component response regulator/predicted RNA-binding protein with RPS1 domain
MSCGILTAVSLEALLDGRLEGPELVAVRAHLAQPCDACLDSLQGEELNSFLERACHGVSERGWATTRNFLLRRAIAGNPTQILVADEDSSVSSGIAVALREEGYVCQIAHSSEQAFALAAVVSPVVIIASTRLVGRDGVRLLDALRIQFPETRVISLAAKADADMGAAVECLRRGAVDYLIGPCERGDLIRSVERALAHRDMVLARKQSSSEALHRLLGRAMSYFTAWPGVSEDVSLTPCDATGTPEGGSTDGIAFRTRHTKQDPWAMLSDKYPIGRRVKGKVRERARSGLLVDVEQSVDGLVRWSDISWSDARCFMSREEIFKEGDEIEAVVLDIFKEGDEVEAAFDIEKDCLSLSLGIKQLLPDPWVTLSERLSMGCRTKGKVTEIAERGAFVEIEPGVEGLLLGRDLNEKCPENPADEVSEGREVQVEVIYIDVRNRRLCLKTTPAPCEGEQFGEASTHPGRTMGSKS